MNDNLFFLKDGKKTGFRLIINNDLSCEIIYNIPYGQAKKYINDHQNEILQDLGCKYIKKEAINVLVNRLVKLNDHQDFHLMLLNIANILNFNEDNNELSIVDGRLAATHKKTWLDYFISLFEYNNKTGNVSNLKEADTFYSQSTEDIEEANTSSCIQETLFEGYPTEIDP